jgi:hypothetical protein
MIVIHRSLWRRTPAPLSVSHDQGYSNQSNLSLMETGGDFSYCTFINKKEKDYKIFTWKPAMKTCHLQGWA